MIEVSATLTGSPFEATVLGLLAPILAADTGAAQQAIAAYQPETEDQFLVAAQIIAFGLAGLDTLRLSMSEDMPEATKIRFRNAANALARTAQSASNTLSDQRRLMPEPTPEPAPIAAPEPDATPEILAALETAQTELKTAKGGDQDRQIDLGWANAMTDVAAEFSAELANLPPAERRLQLRRIGALTEAARSLNRGDVPLQSRLMGSLRFRN